VTRVVQEIAGHLGNTPAVARASYIDPRSSNCTSGPGTIAPALTELGLTELGVTELGVTELGVNAEAGESATQGPAERAVLDLLRRAG
jgi:hypothetical protein